MGVTLRLLSETTGIASIGPYGEPVTPVVAGDHVQPLPDGHQLVVSVRGRGENATVYDASGAVVLRAAVGDAVAHVLTTPTGHVWVGYFDEGVFGGKSPACHGLVRFTPALEVDWTLPEGRVSDCYALNVDGETAWACPYNEFPIIRVAGGVAREWANPVHGAHGLLVRGPRVALLSDYDHAAEHLTVGHLRDKFHVTAEHTLTLPDDRAFPPGHRVVCRGADLYVLTGTHVYHLNLDDVPA